MFRSYMDNNLFEKENKKHIYPYSTYDALLLGISNFKNNFIENNNVNKTYKLKDHSPGATFNIHLRSTYSLCACVCVFIILFC